MASEDPGVHSRRTFIALASAGVATASVGLRRYMPDFQSVLSQVISAEVVDQVDRLFQHIDPKPEAIKAAQELFLGGASGFHVVPSIRLTGGQLPSGPLNHKNGHKSASPEVTQPVQFALQASKKILLRLGATHLPVHEIIEAPLDRNTLLLGGPVANPKVREIMGENGISQKFFVDNNPIKFPFYFDITDKTLGGYSTERLEKETPDWPLIIKDSALPNVDLDNRGRPLEDHVLITSIPQIYDYNAKLRGDRITIFSGRHGVGTRSLGLFTSAKYSEFIDGLNKTSKKSKGWQAIVRISEVASDGLTPLSLDDNLKNIYFEEIPVDFGRVRRIG